MKQNIFQQFLLYKFRYPLAILLYMVALVGLLSLQLTSVPNGLSQQEMQSAIDSSLLQPTAEVRVIDLPYHILQLLSIEFLGLSTLAIKLPSVILGILSGIGLLLLLGRWFKPNVALISALFAVTNSIFLTQGRLGTAVILVIFWATFLLLIATLITQQVRGQFGWKALLGLIVGLALYTPLSIYIIVSALIAGILHPHTRYLLVRYGKTELVVTLFLFTIAIIPLIIGIWYNPTIVRDLTGIPEQLPTGREYAASLWELMLKIGGFVTPKITDTIQPAFNATVLILIALGILRAFADFHATRTYTLLIWTAIILPIVALQQQFIAVLYLPAILFLAIGVQTLIREWYSIFPLNPYARLAGLLPLIALIVGVGYLNYVNYFMGFRYSSLASTYFDDSLRTLNQSLKDERYTKGSVVVVVPNNKVSFFSMLQEEGKDLRVEISNSVAITPNTSYFVDSRSMLPPDTAAALGTPKDFVVSSKKNNDLRWRVYQK